MSSTHEQHERHYEEHHERHPHRAKNDVKQDAPARSRGIVHALQANGFAATRVPLSGAVGGRFAGDVVLLLEGAIRFGDFLSLF
jgi:hypothetical protein